MVQINGTEFLFGCDPEVWVKNRSGVIVSAHGMIEGTKDNPKVIPDGMVQVDGMALEFGIDASPDFETFYSKIDSVVNQLQKMLPRGYTLCFQPIAEFTEAVMKKQPPEALELGCEPDFSCYTMKPNPRPNAEGRNFRSAGGHVHIGWTRGLDPFVQEHLLTCSTLTYQLDKYIGVPSLYWDKDEKRRSLYGKAGCFRPKPYGLEYRSLSNMWLLKKETIKFVFENSVKAIQETVNAEENLLKKMKFFKGALEVEPKEIINNSFSALGESVFREKSARV